MAEVGLVFGAIDASAGLILKCGSVAKTLNDLAGKYKKAELTLKTVTQQVDAIKAAWVRIQEWYEEYRAHTEISATDDELLNRLKTSLECGDLVISALEVDLVPFRSIKSTLGIKQRSRFIWEETALQDHQVRLRDQVSTMGLLLQVLKLPAQYQPVLLKYSESEFGTSDESAFSIVPSHMSLSTHRDVSSISVESAELIYRSLSFENQLFTARVYKRNYRTPAIHSLLRRQVQTPPAVVPSIPLTSPDAFLSNIINTEPGFKAVHTVASTGDVSFMGVLLARGADVSETTSFERWTPLYLAARAGDLPMTELLVLKGADVNSRSFDGDQPIHAVSRCSDSGALEVVSLLLESGVDVNSPGLDSKRALHLAARSANLPLTKLLLGKGADIYSQGFHGDHPIHAASRCSDSTSLDVVGLLLEHGASVHDPNTYSVRPLQLATRHGNLSLARLLLENGADVNCHWSRCPCPDYPIHYASRLSNETSIGMVSLLMDYGAPVNDPNRYFEGPLHLAGQSGNLPLTKLLLERRADVNIKSIAGDQPLHATLRRSHTLTLEVASLLLEYGAAVDCPNKELERPLHLAVRMPQLRVAKLLLQKGADVNSRSRGSDQPIHMACRNRSLDMVEILLDYGANVNGKTIGGYQPLHVAATSGEQPSLIKLLVRKGAAIEAKSQGSFSQTALGLACINANIPNIRQLLVLYANACIEVPRAMLDVALEYRLPPVVDLLLEYGLDPNTAAASSDRTCWMDLLELANKPRETKYIVQSLIEHGADVRSTSQYGNQPLHYLALSRGRLEWNEDVKEMVDILLANGADLNALNVLGESPLLFAASRMDYGLTSYFLDKGATPLSSLPFFPSY